MREAESGHLYHSLVLLCLNLVYFLGCDVVEMRKKLIQGEYFSNDQYANELKVLWVVRVNSALEKNWCLLADDLHRTWIHQAWFCHIVTSVDLLRKEDDEVLEAYMSNYCQNLLCVVDTEIFDGFFKHHIADLEKIQVVLSNDIDHPNPSLVMTSSDCSLLKICRNREDNLCVSSRVLLDIRHPLELAHFLINSLLAAFVCSWVVSFDLLEEFLRHKIDQFAFIVFKVDQIIEQSFAIFLIVPIPNQQQYIRKKLYLVEPNILPTLYVKFLKKIHPFDSDMMDDKINYVVVLADPGEYLFLGALFHVAVQAINKTY